MSTETYIPRDPKEPMEIVHGILALTYRQGAEHFDWLEELADATVDRQTAYILYESYEWKRIMSVQRGAITLHVCDSWYDRNPRTTRKLEHWLTDRQILLIDIPAAHCKAGVHSYLGGYHR